MLEIHLVGAAVFCLGNGGVNEVPGSGHEHMMRMTKIQTEVELDHRLFHAAG